MELVNGTTKIEVKLLASGRYVWTITSLFNNNDVSIEKIKDFDNTLKKEFPDYARRGSGRIASMDEE